jgi:hypothetical protein
MLMKLKFVPALALAAGLASMVTPVVAQEATQDAQSVYSTQDVGVARRNFRSQCLRYQPAERCECYTAGFAQALGVPEMRLATALLPARFGANADVKARALAVANRNTMAMSHIDAVEKDLAKACVKVGGPETLPAS